MSEKMKRALRTLGILYILSPIDLMTGVIYDDLIVLSFLLLFFSCLFDDSKPTEEVKTDVRRDVKPA